MAQLALAAAGAVVGGIVGGPMGASIGWSLGTVAGGMLFPPTGPHSEGPRANDRVVQISTYGAPIPRCYGTYRLAGNVFWAKELEEVRTDSEFGGKGGGSASTSTTYSYYGSFAVALCQGPIAGVGRIWADGKLIYASALLASGKYGDVTVYLGSEVQTADPTIQADKGVEDTPAFRGTAYIVFPRMPLADFGNRIPNITVEVVATAETDFTVSSGAVAWTQPTLPNNSGGGATTGNQWRNPAQTTDTNGATYWNDYNFQQSGLILDSAGAQIWAPTSASIHALAVTHYGVAAEASPGKLVLAPIRGGEYIVALWEYGAFQAKKGVMLFAPITSSSPTPLGFVHYDRQDSPPYNGASVVTQLGVGRDLDCIVVIGGMFPSHSAMVVLPSPAQIMAGTFAAGWDASGLGSFSISSSAYQIPCCFADNNVTAWYDWLGTGTETGGWVGSQVAAGPSGILPTAYAYRYFDTVWCAANAGSNTDAAANPGGFVARWLIGPEYHFPTYANQYHNSGGTFVPSRHFGAPADIITTGLGIPFGDEMSNPLGGTLSSAQPYLPTVQYKPVNPAAPEGAWLLALIQPINVSGSPAFDSGQWYAWVRTRLFLYSGVTDTFTAMGTFTGPVWDAAESVSGTDSTNGYPFVDVDPVTQAVSVYSGILGAGIVKSAIGTVALGGAADLADIVADLAEASGLDTAQYDVTDLVGVSVAGYLVGRETTGRGAIEPLMQVYQFDGYESDAKLKFRRRGGASVLTVAEAELGASGGMEPQPTMSERRRQDIELPASVTLRYVSPTLDYQMAAASDKRISPAFRAGDPLSVEVPISLGDTEAKERASLILYQEWLQRTAFRFTLPPSRVKLDPTDVITVTWGTSSADLMLTQVTQGADGVLECEGVSTDTVTFVAPPVESAIIAPTAQTVGTIQSVTLELLDLPLLRDEDDSPGFYLAATGTDSTWRGGAVYRASAGSTDYTSFAATPTGAVLGVATTLLADGTTTVFDMTNTVSVTVPAGMALESRTKVEVLGGANVAMIGDELIGFTTATQVTPTLWTLSGLLRGARGTDWATASHAIGDRFVLLRTNGSVQSIGVSAAEYGVSKNYRGVSIGGFVDDAADVAFAPTFERLKPLSPVHVAGSRDGSNNLTVTWVRRARVDGDWRDGVETPLDEPTESYEVDVVSGLTVLRTLSATSPTATYSAANQVTDGLTPGDPVTLNIYQISSRVGRGHARSATV